MRVKEIVNFIENLAPLTYQESYDNSGLIVGSHDAEVNKVLVTLDVTESVIEEAVEKKCELVLAHHPIIFRGIKKLNGGNYVERTVINAIRHNISIYAAHTNLDNANMGVNRKIGEKLGLKDLKILEPKKHILSGLVTFCPTADTKNVLDALHKAGAGEVGDYSHCSFKSVGEGTFRPTGNANPHIGELDQVAQVKEDRIEVHFPSYLEAKLLKVLHEAHPYEEVAYHVHKLENLNQTVGSGMIGRLVEPMSGTDFLCYLKSKMELKSIRYTPLLNRPISNVAFCGGAGSFLLKRAIWAGADVFISADFKYHEFFDAEGQLTIMDIGHYESEVFTKDLLIAILKEKFTNIAPVLSAVDTNPVRYF